MPTLPVKYAVTTYDPEKKSFVLNFAVDEGPQYRFGAIKIDSALDDVDVQHALRGQLRHGRGR